MPGVPPAVRPQRDLPAAGQPVRPARQLRPCIVSHVIPALIRKCVEAQRARRRDHRRLGHGPGQPRVPVRRRLRRRARRWRWRTTTRRAGEPRQRPRDHDQGPDRAGRAAHRFGGRDRLGLDQARRPAPPVPGLSRAREAFGFSAKTPLREGLTARLSGMRRRRRHRRRCADDRAGAETESNESSAKPSADSNDGPSSRSPCCLVDCPAVGLRHGDVFEGPRLGRCRGLHNQCDRVLRRMTHSRQDLDQVLRERFRHLST